MLIDWVTVVAQIVNFLILVYLLKRFLYGPIVRAMNEREERIREEIESAERARADAEDRAAALDREREELEGRREELLDKAREEVRRWREEALQKAKGEVERARRTWMEGFSMEQEQTRAKIRKALTDQVLAVSRKVLSDLADGSLERSAVDKFLRGLEESKQVQAENRGEEVLVELGFDSPEQLEEIRTRLAGIFDAKVRVRAEINPDLGFGIMILAGDRKWDWSLARYLEDLERTLFDRMSSVAVGTRQ